MAHMTISEVSKRLGISARMLRYYEKEGMIESTHTEDYAYRVYDENTVRRIRQIITLRRLRLPLKKIRVITDGSRQEAARILKEALTDTEQCISSMQTVKQALCKLSELLQSKEDTDFLTEDVIEEMTALLPLEKHRLDDDGKSVYAQKESHIRIVLLPPCTVASYQYIGENPEEKVGDVMDKFVRSERLYEKKPDSRLFGFNSPDYGEDGMLHGYEDWVTIPDDMEVPAPLSKKHFDGGLYAAYTVNFPDFFEWDFLKSWIENNERYQADYSDDAGLNMGGCLEEHLNWVYSAHTGWPLNGIDGKIDLLLPIKPK